MAKFTVGGDLRPPVGLRLVTYYGYGAYKIARRLFAIEVIGAHA